MRFYVGERNNLGVTVMVHRIGPERVITPLRPRNDLRCYGNGGFDWGIRDSGCANLSLALLSDLVGDDERILKTFMWFAGEVLATIRVDRWAFPAETFRFYAEAVERAVAAQDDLRTPIVGINGVFKLPK